MKSIKELSKQYNVSSRTIRYYEQLFSLISIKKSNVRYYDVEEQNKIKIIITLRKLNFPLNKIKDIIINCNQDKIIQIINEEKYKLLEEVKEITNNIMLLNNLKLMITNSNDDNLEDFILSDLFENYKDGKIEYVNNKLKKQHQILETFFEMIKKKELHLFKQYCSKEMKLNDFINFIYNEIKLDQTLIEYKIYSQYSLYDGKVFVETITKNETITFNFIFDPNDIIIGIWVVGIKKHNS